MKHTPLVQRFFPTNAEVSLSSPPSIFGLSSETTSPSHSSNSASRRRRYTVQAEGRKPASAIRLTPNRQQTLASTRTAFPARRNRKPIALASSLRVRSGRRSASGPVILPRSPPAHASAPESLLRARPARQGEKLIQLEPDDVPRTVSRRGGASAISRLA